MLMKSWINDWPDVVRQPAWWGIAALFLCLTVPLALSTRTDNNYSWDEMSYHIPAIRQISEEWPLLSVKDDSLSASPPGYHWFLAGVSKIVGSDVRTLRMVNLVISLAGLMVLFDWLQRRILPIDTALLIAPLAASNFYVKSAAWVVTDNPGLILAMLALMQTLGLSTRVRNAAAAGLFGGFATFTRQLHAWIAVPIFCRALVSGLFADARGVGTRIQFCAWAAASSVPVVVVAALYASWSGLVPPHWQDLAVSFSAVPLVYGASVFALFGAFYCAFRADSQPIRAEPTIWISALLVGTVLAASATTEYDYALGHWGGYLWEIVRISPALFGRSIVLTLLALVGVLFVVGLYLSIRAAGDRNGALIWLVAIISWSLMFLPQRQVFQRYFEPMILVFLILAVGMSGATSLGAARRTLLVSLTVIQILITLVTAWWRTLLS